MGAGSHVPLGDEYQKARDEFDPIYYLIGFVIFMLFFCMFNRDKSEAKKKANEPEEKGKLDPKNTFFTLDQLKEYDGTGPSGKIYLACFEQVFDVSASPNYQAGGAYASFAGKDVTVACAKHSTDLKDLSTPYDPQSTTFTFDQEQTMMTFYMTFCQKYRIVGKLLPQSAKKAQ